MLNIDEKINCNECDDFTVTDFSTGKFIPICHYSHNVVDAVSPNGTGKREEVNITKWNLHKIRFSPKPVCPCKVRIKLLKEMRNEIVSDE